MYSSSRQTPSAFFQIHLPSQPPPSFSALPTSVHRRLAAYLNAHDCTALAQSCSRLRSIYNSLRWNYVIVVPDSYKVPLLEPSRCVPVKAVISPQKYAWYASHRVVVLRLHESVLNTPSRRGRKQLATWWTIDPASGERGSYYVRLLRVELHLQPSENNYAKLESSAFYQTLAPKLAVHIEHYTPSVPYKPRHEFFYSLRDTVTSLDLCCFLPRSRSQVQMAPPGLAALVDHFGDLPRLRKLTVLVDFSTHQQVSSSAPFAWTLRIHSAFRTLALIPPTIPECTIRFQYVDDTRIHATQPSPLVEELHAAEQTKMLLHKYAIPVVTVLECHTSTANAAQGHAIDLPILLGTFSFPRVQALSHNELGLPPCIFYRAFGGSGLAASLLPQLVYIELLVDIYTCVNITAGSDGGGIEEFFARLETSVAVHRPRRLVVNVHLTPHSLYRRKIKPFLQVVRRELVENPTGAVADSHEPSPPPSPLSSMKKLSAPVMDALIEAVSAPSSAGPSSFSSDHIDFLSNPAYTPPDLNPVIEMLGLLAEPAPSRIFSFQHLLALSVNDSHVLLAYLFFEALMHQASQLGSLEYLHVNCLGRFLPVSHCLQRICMGVGPAAAIKQVLVSTKIPGAAHTPREKKKTALRRVLKALPMVPYMHHTFDSAVQASVDDESSWYRMHSVMDVRRRRTFFPHSFGELYLGPVLGKDPGSGCGGVSPLRIYEPAMDTAGITRADFEGWI